MPRKTLLESNPYLRDATQRKKGLWQSAKSSSAVEGILKPFTGRRIAVVLPKGSKR